MGRDNGGDQGDTPCPFLWWRRRLHLHEHMDDRRQSGPRAEDGSLTDRHNSSLGAHLGTDLAITADEAVRRLSARILAVSKRTGSFDKRFIGHFVDRRCTI